MEESVWSPLPASHLLGFSCCCAAGEMHRPIRGAVARQRSTLMQAGLQLEALNFGGV